MVHVGSFQQKIRKAQCRQPCRGIFIIIIVVVVVVGGLVVGGLVGGGVVGLAQTFPEFAVML